MTFKCEWCNKTYKTEENALGCACIYKARWAMKDDPLCIRALRLWLSWHRQSGIRVKSKGQMRDFVKDSLYDNFLKLARFLHKREFFEDDPYIHHLLTANNGTPFKMKDWTYEPVYTAFICKRYATEDPIAAITRSVRWLDTQAETPADACEALNHNTIRLAVASGQLTPWIVLQHQGLLQKVSQNAETVEALNQLLNIAEWNRRFRANPDYVDTAQRVIKGLLEKK